MNPVVTSREKILETCRELIRRQGWPAINIRTVAEACNVSVGSLYNYFDSKAALVSATVQSIWQEIFHRPKDGAEFQDIATCITWMYQRMEYGCQRYPDFFTLHALGFLQEEKPEGRQQMQRMWQHILDGLCSVLKRDGKIPADAFTDGLPVEKFAHILFSFMLSALFRKEYDPAAVLEIVNRTLYEYHKGV